MLRLYESERLAKPEQNDILVFGSNTQGRHGKGSALLAKEKYGAIYGQAVGRQGNAYAICTKNLTVKVHPSVSKEHIVNQIRSLYLYAKNNQDLNFLIVYSGVGKNLNAYSNNDLAQMFLDACDKIPFFIPANVLFQNEFASLIESLYKKS